MRLSNYDELDLTGQPEAPDYGAMTYGGSPVESSGNWGGFFSDIANALPQIVNTYGQIKTLDTQLDIQQARAQQQLQYPFGAAMGANGLTYPGQYTYPQNYMQTPAPSMLSRIPLPLIVIGFGLLTYAATRK